MSRKPISRRRFMAESAASAIGLGLAGSVAAGTIQPPGHMQNENTPRRPPSPSVCCTSL